MVINSHIGIQVVVTLQATPAAVALAKTQTRHWLQFILSILLQVVMLLLFSLALIKPCRT